MLEVLGQVFWFILPAYIANSVAVDVSGLPILKNYSTPVDFGRSFQGKRIFGDGKTWRGLICAVIAAAVCGHFMGVYHGFGVEKIGVGIVRQNAKLGFLLGLGAMLGDMFASFMKRRFNFERGAVAPLLDQLDFILGAFLFASMEVKMGLHFLLVTSAVTIPIHLIANWVAYILKLKKSPW